MVKIHNNKLVIANNTMVPLTFLKEWFDSGRVADGFKWPSVISPGAKETVLCYESELLIRWFLIDGMLFLFVYFKIFNIHYQFFTK